MGVVEFSEGQRVEFRLGNGIKPSNGRCGFGRTIFRIHLYQYVTYSTVLSAGFRAKAPAALAQTKYAQTTAVQVS